jgi:hypothetical protein
MSKIEPLLENFQQFVEGAVQPEELAEVVDSLTSIIKDLKEASDNSTQLTEEKLSKVLASFSGVLKRLEKVEKELPDLREGRGNTSIQKLTAICVSLRTEIGQLEQKIISTVDLIPLESQIQAVKQDLVGAISKVSTESTGEVIVEKINDLPIDQDSFLIDAKHIKGLKKLFDTWIKAVGTGKTMFVGGGASSGGRSVKAYDLSSSLDGVTKTFNLPALWRVISVHASSFPGVLRETVDYTWTSSSITFTTEISAASTLATGQTLIIIYAEA